MTVPAELAALQWALSYPFARPTRDYVFIDGESYPIAEYGGSIFECRLDVHGEIQPIEAVLGAERAARLAAEALHPVLAIGSNASPVQMRRKFYEDPHPVFVPVLTADVFDASIRFMNRISGYGSIPVTIWPEERARCRCAVTLLPDRERQIIDGTEAIGEVYEVVDVAYDFAGIDWAIEKERASAYRCLTGQLGLGAATAQNVNTAAIEATQWEAQEKVIRLLDLRMSVEEFILENLHHPETRRARDAALSRIAG